MAIKKDLTGLAFNRLTIINEAEPYKSPSGRFYVMWNCRCSCGKELKIRSSSITSNSSFSKSCGCLSAELTKKRATIHGKSNTREYTSYQAMVKRCNNKNDPSYHHYGGRGITVCDNWLGDNGFKNFLIDMGGRPKDYTLDRINSNGNYEFENCRWASRTTQQRNRASKKEKTLSNFMGVTYARGHDCWNASVNGKNLGYFDCDEEAADFRDSYIINNNLENTLNPIHLFKNII